MKDPTVENGRRVLGVVPGTPATGERKEPSEQDLVMVSPHLLVRHAVVALVGGGILDMEDIRLTPDELEAVYKYLVVLSTR